MHMRLFYEKYDASGVLENRRAHDLTIRIVNRDELGLMLRLGGFETEAVYGGFEGEPFDSASDHLVVLARKSGFRLQASGYRSWIFVVKEAAGEPS